VKIFKPSVETVADAVRISAQIECDHVDAKSGRLWIEWPSHYASRLSDAVDPFVVLMASVAGYYGEDVNYESAIDQRLWHNLHEASAVYAWYWPLKSKRIRFLGSTEARDRKPGALASFYSGGVDSLYNLAEMKWRAQNGFGRDIDELWLVRGFDVGLEDDLLWDKVRSRLVDDLSCCLPQQVACISTNLREFHPGANFWPELGFSSALGAVAKCVASTVDEVLIGSYGTYAQCIPHASSPLVDPLWSCSRQSINHFSCRVSRAQKIASIADHFPELLDGIRVCYQNPEGAYNCGACEKCLRTGIQMALIGVEHTCTSFEWPLDIQAVRQLRLPWREESSSTWTFWKEILDQCKHREGMEEYAAAIRYMLRRSRLNLPKRLLRKPYRHWKYGSAPR